MTEKIIGVVTLTTLAAFVLLSIGVYRNKTGWAWLATVTLLAGFLVCVNVAMAADSPVELKKTDKYGHPTGEGGYVVQGNRIVPVDKYGHRTGAEGYVVRPDGSVVKADKYGNPK